MGTPVRIMGAGENEAIQAQVTRAEELKVIMAGYSPSDIDETGDPAYYGFTDSIGQYYIMRLNTASGTVRYATGVSGYVVAWAGRAGLDYDYYYNAF